MVKYVYIFKNEKYTLDALLTSHLKLTVSLLRSVLRTFEIFLLFIFSSSPRRETFEESKLWLSIKIRETKAVLSLFEAIPWSVMPMYCPHRPRSLSASTPHSLNVVSLLYRVTWRQRWWPIPVANRFSYPKSERWVQPGQVLSSTREKRARSNRDRDWDMLPILSRSGSGSLE